MQLSEAILKGCETTAHGYGAYIYKQDRDICACALGAALVGFGAVEQNNVGLVKALGFDLMHKPPVDTLPTKTHCIRGVFDDLFQQITLLNDYHGMTREEISEGLAKAGY
jgi:hypothetical protein